MISVVTATLNDGERLGPTLAALTSAALDGFVREVIVADDGSTDGTLAAAEDAGARFFGVDGSPALAAGCACARQPWLLLLEPGTRPQAGWEQAAWRHINDHSDRAGWFRLSLRAEGLRARATEARITLEAGLIGRLVAENGLLISRRLYEARLETHAPPAALPLRLPRSALRPLNARVLA
jgi:hypothetical protein